jgi:hypothetical protein
MIRIWKSPKKKKPWIEIPKAPNELLLDSNSNLTSNWQKMPSENFAILCQLTKGPSVQPIEIIRHVDASFYLK